jgi:hypothetical protein
MRHLLFLFAFISVTANAQNFLTSLYDLKPGENFPADMKKAKIFIDKITAGQLVYNFMPGSTGNGVSNSQIELRSLKPLKFGLPYTGGMALEIVDYKTKQPALKHTFYIDYIFPYKRYEQDFSVDQKLFELQNYFNQAMKLTDTSYGEMVNKILMHLFSQQPYDSRYAFFIEAINKKYKPSPAIASEDFEDVKSKSQTMTENSNELANVIAETFEDEMSEVLFTTFVEDKTSDENTIANLKKIFDRDIIDVVDDLFVQKIIINTNKGGMLNVPAKYLVLKDDKQLFPADNITMSLDFKNKSLSIEFNSSRSVDLIVKGKTPAKGQKAKDVEVNSRKLIIVIFETQTLLYVEELGKKTRHEIIIDSVEK